MDNLSIIIRNRNEAEYIGFALQSICDFIPKAEVIVVDNNSTDDSLNVVGLFSDRLDIKKESIDRYTPGRSINLGVNKASKDYILILSAHCQITSVDLDLITENLNKFKAVFGQQNPIYRGKKITKRYIWSHFGDEEIVNMYSDIENRLFFHNAFSFFKKETLINSPMPEKYSGKEDRYWAKDIVKKGSEYIYIPNNVNENHTLQFKDIKDIEISLTSLNSAVTKMEIEYEKHPAEDKYDSSITAVNSGARTKLRITSNNENVKRVKLDANVSAPSTSPGTRNNDFYTYYDKIIGEPKIIIKFTVVNPKFFNMDVGDIVTLILDSEIKAFAYSYGDKEFWIVTDIARSLDNLKITLREV